MSKLYKYLFIFILFGLIGCSGVKNLVKPDLQVPSTYGGGEELDSLTIADLGWCEFYGDEYLKDIIKRVLQENKNLQIAAERVEQAQSLYKVDKASLLPELSFRLPWNHETNEYYK